MDGSGTPPAGPVENDDLDLIRRVAAHDRQAFEALYRRHARRVYGYLWKLLRRRYVVEEVLDDVMLVIWKDAARFNFTSRLSTWILGIAHYKALKALRRCAPVPAEDLRPWEQADEGLGPEAAAERHELRRAVTRALETLSSEQRVVVELAFYHGRSYREIAEIVGRPVNTIKTRMLHARRRLAPVFAELAMDRLGPREEP